jgi:UDP-N-acetylmuramoyl-L-alanyl-D-glutamate--2,6-diaminopimelate ligase
VAGAQSIRPQHPRSSSLSEIALSLGVSNIETSTISVSGVASSSSDVVPGDLFFGLPGAKEHGARFAGKAIEAGAVAIVTDSVGAALVINLGVPVLVIEDPRSALAPVSASIYGTATLRPKLYAVTGTNGKTTVAYLLAALLESLGLSAGLSSTSERRIGSEVFESGLTTPESNQMHALLARMNEARVQAAVIEVSAHALSRHRVDALSFEVVGFTNFSQDHLDDYGSLDEYFAAKKLLFTRDRAARGVVVIDSEWGRAMVEASQIPVSTIGYSNVDGVDWHVDILSRTPVSTEFRLSSQKYGSLQTVVPLVGDYSALNASLAIVMLVEGGHSFDLIAQTLISQGGIRVAVPGRTELVSGSRGPLAYVDYGHTPEAFEHTLRAIRAITPGKVVMIFGADGDRDTSKRAAMGAAAARGADVVIVTDFHPRSEDPRVIRAALLEGAVLAGTSADIREVADPREAVRVAVSLVGNQDAILYAGPGHEDYRDVGSQRISYNAREDMRAALAEAGWSR